MCSARAPSNRLGRRQVNRRGVRRHNRNSLLAQSASGPGHCQDENELSLSETASDRQETGLIMSAERSTRQRVAIMSAIGSAGRPLSPLEVLHAARRMVKALGMATVYRNLKRLAAQGSVQAITLPGERARYELRESAHHHHFQCTRCRRVFDVLGCPGNLRGLAPRGFRVERHDVTLYGRCSECATNVASARG